jgi:hypothetical protein
MRPDEVVIVAPTGDDLPRFGQTEEHMLVQALVPQSAVEAFDESILHRFARLDIMKRADWMVGASAIRTPETLQDSMGGIRSSCAQVSSSWFGGVVDRRSVHDYRWTEAVGALGETRSYYVRIPHNFEAWLRRRWHGLNPA